MDGLYYSNERNVQILLALLKANGIRKVIASPGATNVTVVASMQRDPFFEMYSCIDERSAAYMACGLAAETGEPVVLSCTGATSSRNYMPALTEAYYRKLPVIAVTSSMVTCKVGHLVAQATNRTLPPPDTVKLSLTLPVVKDADDEFDCTVKVNKAIVECRRHGCGPVHLNLETTYSRDYSVRELPPIRQIRHFVQEDSLPQLPDGRVAIFMGSCRYCSEEEGRLIDSFCSKYDAVVFCDHTSGYKGRYRVQYALAAGQVYKRNDLKHVRLLIHVGNISGDYYSLSVIPDEVWRVDEDGEIRDTFRKLTCVFEMGIGTFFSKYSGSVQESGGKETYLHECLSYLAEVRAKLPELPLSNIWVASRISANVPSGAKVHLGILNTLRAWNFFDVPSDVKTYCNVGGFGIDGVLSTALGASLADPGRLYYVILGDLAFFYDMNVLGNRHYGNNVRIMLINNGKGAEFRNFGNIGDLLGESTDPYIAAAGHNGNQSETLVRDYVNNLGFDYFQVMSKADLDSAVGRFMNPVMSDRPMFVEVFTSSEDESEALRLVLNAEPMSANEKAKDMIASVLGRDLTRAVKRAFGK